MGALQYGSNMSLDGFIEDEHGNFDFAEPDEQVHQFWNDLVRPVDLHLYGRRLYETMAVWETDPSLAAESEIMRDFAESWQSADKVVFSRTLREPVTARTRIEPSFDADLVRQLKQSTEAPLLIGGAELGMQAFALDLVDEVHLVVSPVVLGGGKRALPSSRVNLELISERRFASGAVHLHARVRRDGPGAAAT